LTLCETLISEGYAISENCPFCGEDLSAFPLFVILKPVHSEEYLIAKLNKGHFLGGDNGYEVRCIRCGASGGRDTSPREAINKWNNRTNKPSERTSMR
jgi:hypothetical protein